MITLTEQTLCLADCKKAKQVTDRQKERQTEMNTNKHTVRKSYTKSTFRVRRMVIQQQHKTNKGYTERQTDEERYIYK